VYILDTGLRTTHYEFRGRVGAGASAVGSSVEDDQGHGTHVSGTADGSGASLTWHTESGYFIFLYCARLAGPWVCMHTNPDAVHHMLTCNMTTTVNPESANSVGTM
jgi:subtilisin family serine protease